jgi:hypothetical protein
MFFWLTLVFLSAVGFGTAVEFDRPDLVLPYVTKHWMEVHVAAAGILLFVLLRLSWFQVADRGASWNVLTSVVSRNVLVLFCALLLTVYISHMLLNGMDPTGHRKLW